MILETLTSFLSSCSVLEIVCLALSVLVLVLSLVIAFCYKNSRLRTIVLFIINIISIFINIELSIGKLGDVVHHYVGTVFLCGMCIALVFYGIYLVIETIQNQEKTEQYSD